MPRDRRSSPGSDRILGPTGLAVAALVVGLSCLLQTWNAVAAEEWPAAALFLLLSLLCGYVAVRQWRRRSAG